VNESEPSLATERIIERERQVRDEEAEDYSAHRARDRYDREVEEACILQALALGPSDTVLDAGCGTGQYIPVLLAQAGRVIAVDHSQASIELASGCVPAADASRVTFHAADIRRLPVEDASVDAVVSNGVLQHIPTEEARLEALRELHRVLRPGGRVALNVYRWRGHIRRDKEGYWPTGIYRYAFTARELRRAFDDAGFSAVRVGGTVVAPALCERLGIGVDLQRRLVHNVLARPFAHYVIASAIRG
jgi:ubiquinone/menaquinone biosynthesis C-methylase UbiE